MMAMIRPFLISLLIAMPALADVTDGKGKTIECFCTDTQGSRVERPADRTMIPYYAWCHRGAGAMAVWRARTASE